MLQTYYTLVEEAITGLGINAEETRGEEAGQWNLKKGKFDIMIDVWQQDEHILFQVVCPLCGLPDENREGFMMHILQKNYSLSSVSYAIMEDNVYVKHTTEANTLTKEYITMLLTKTAFYAEQSTFVPAD